MSALDNARAAIARYDSFETDVAKYHSMKAAAEALRDLIAEHERLTEARDAAIRHRSDIVKVNTELKQRVRAAEAQVARLTAPPTVVERHDVVMPIYEEGAAPLTDDEREALERLLRDLPDPAERASAILDAGFRRRGPITDEMVEAAMRAHDYSLDRETTRDVLEAAEAAR